MSLDRFELQVQDEVDWMKPAAALALCLVCATGPALAAGPAPTKPVAVQFFSGRWYEIARSPNPRQRDCQAPTYDFGAREGGDPSFVLTCRKGSPTGRAERLSVRIKLPPGGANNRFRVSAMGGLLGADYLILDRADDLSWAILSINDSRDVWLLARQPALDPPLRQAAVGRIGALGYNAAQLVYPRH